MLPSNKMGMFRRCLMMPSRADIIVCGSGLSGSAVSCYLAKQQGYKRIFVLEQHSNLSSGSTLHTPSLFTCLHSSYPRIHLARMSLMAYEELMKLGYDIGYQRTGSFTISRTYEGSIHLKKQNSILNGLGVKTRMLTSFDLKRQFPLIDCDEIMDVLYIPDDGIIDPNKLRKAFGDLAKSLGVTFINSCKVLNVETRSSPTSSLPEVSGVITDNGYIQTRDFINCAGLWSRYIGSLSKPRVHVSGGPCLISKVRTSPLPQIALNLPSILIDVDANSWVYKDDDQLVITGFAKAGSSVKLEEIPENFPTTQIESDWDLMLSPLRSGLRMIPLLENMYPDSIITSAEFVSTDGYLICGESNEVKNYYIMTAMCGLSVSFVGGAAQMLVNQLTRISRSKYVIWPFHPSRFNPVFDNDNFIMARTNEVSSSMISSNYNKLDFAFYESCRNMRVSPLFKLLKEKGGQFALQSGFEWPLFFEPNSAVVDGMRLKSYIYHKPKFLRNVYNEYFCCRQGVGLIDMCGMSKVVIESEDDSAVKFLEKVCFENVDKPIGTVVHSPVLNRLGTYENDVLITRLSYSKFLMISSCLNTSRCIPWLRRLIEPSSKVILRDCTSAYCALCLTGPKAPELLHELTNQDLSFRGFPFLTSKYLDFETLSKVLVMRVSFVGEDGFTLVAPVDVATHIYEILFAYGYPYHIKDVGYYAITSLRLERALDYWANELTQFITPLESGRPMKKTKEFVGKRALLTQQRSGLFKRIAQFSVDGHDSDENIWPSAGDPIFNNGQLCGFVTSSFFGFGLEKQLLFATLASVDDKPLPANFIMKSNFEIEIAGTRYRLTPHVYAPRSHLA